MALLLGHGWASASARRTALAMLGVMLGTDPARGQTTCAQWREVGPIPSYGAMAYDSARRVTVLTVRRVHPDTRIFTYEWDGERWRLRSTTGPQAQTVSNTMCYDTTRGVTMYLDDAGRTWEWDGESWRMRDVTGPSPRRGHGLVYDEARRVCVLFGGYYIHDGANYLGDTWEYDGRAWRQRDVQGPSRRAVMHSMSYDRDRGITVLYAGSGESSHFLCDTWEYDGSRWIERVGDCGVCNTGSSLIYDPVRRVTVKFGGDPSPAYQLWDGVEWKYDTFQVIGDLPGYPYIATGTHRAIAYDSHRDRIITFGGVVWTWDQFFVSDTWEFAADNTLRLLDLPPMPHGEADMVYDDVAGRPLLIDAYVPGRVWTYDAQYERWHVRDGDGPPLLWRKGVAFDSKRGVTVLFGGQASGAVQDQHWEYDGVNWMQRSQPGPSPRAGHAMAFDAARGVTVVFGGSAATGSNETWTWDGKEWTLVATTGPSPRTDAMMVFDEARGVLVLFGGYSNGYFNETWEWDGATWTLVATTGPGPRSGQGMAFAPNLGGVVIYGGLIPIPGQPPNYSTISRDVWLWNGEQWTPLPDHPDYSYYIGMVFDPARERLLTFGGGGSTARSRWFEFGNDIQFTQQPWPQRLLVGQPATLSAAATSASPIEWKWHKDGQPIQGATLPTLVIPAVSEADEGTYVAIATNHCGPQPSIPAQLTVGTQCAADVVPSPGDGVVDINDLLAVISAWGPCPAPPTSCPSNIVASGSSATAVDIDDLLAVISAWGPCP